jgi:hypothetical protein
MDDENIQNRQLFDDLDEEENTTEVADDEMMNVSGGGSGGSSTDEDEEMLRCNESSSNTFHKSVEFMVEDIFDEDDDEHSGRQWGCGSQVGRSQNKPRDFVGAFQCLMSNYSNGTASKYDEKDFKRRFCMPRSVFTNIWEKIRGKGLFVESKMNFIRGPKNELSYYIVPFLHGFTVSSYF